MSAKIVKAPGNVLIVQVKVERAEVEGATHLGKREQPLQLAGERESRRRLPVMQRLDAEPVRATNSSCRRVSHTPNAYMPRNRDKHASPQCA